MGLSRHECRSLVHLHRDSRHRVLIKNMITNEGNVARDAIDFVIMSVLSSEGGYPVLTANLRLIAHAVRA